MTAPTDVVRDVRAANDRPYGGTADGRVPSLHYLIPGPCSPFPVPWPLAPGP